MSLIQSVNDKSSPGGLGGRLARTQTRVFYVPCTFYARLWPTFGVFAKKKDRWTGDVLKDAGAPRRAVIR
jgi:hypothetical protein